MGGSSKPNFPDPPGFKQDPFVRGNIDFLSSVGQSLARGGFMPGQETNLPPGYENVDLSFLEENVTLNPEITQQAVGLATRDITDQAERFRLDTVNQLEANNQLTSSTANTSLADINKAFNADIADVATTFHLADVERALSNRIGLFQTGLDTTNSATSLGLTNQSQENAAIQTQFQNRLGLEAERFSRQQASERARARTVGFFTGPAGGAIYGGLNSGSQGASAGLSGGLESSELFLRALSAGAGGAGSSTALKASRTASGGA